MCQVQGSGLQKARESYGWQADDSAAVALPTSGSIAFPSLPVDDRILIIELPASAARYVPCIRIMMIGVV